MTLQEQMQTFPSCLNAPEGRGWLHFPLLRLQRPSTDPSPAQQDPVPLPHSTSCCCSLERAGGSSVFLLLCLLFKKPQPTRILNLRRVIPITLSISTFSLLIADHKVSFTFVFQRKTIIFTSKEQTQPPLFFTPAIDFVH